MVDNYESPPPMWNNLPSKREKVRAQVKSRFYYLFWGVATFSVVAGQLYVGSGYRQMSRSFNRIMDAIVIELVPDAGRHPMLAPDAWMDDQVS